MAVGRRGPGDGEPTRAYLSAPGAVTPALAERPPERPTGGDSSHGGPSIASRAGARSAASAAGGPPRGQAHSPSSPAPDELVRPTADRQLALGAPSASTRPPSARLPIRPPRSRAPRSPAIERHPSYFAKAATPPPLAEAPGERAHVLPSEFIERYGKVRDVFTAEQRARHPMAYPFRRLQGSEAMWLRSKSVFLGTFGRISMGRALHADGALATQKVAIKETHEQSKHVAEKTAPMSFIDAFEEAARTRFIREHIEGAARGLERRVWPGHGPTPLETVRTGWQKSIVFDSFYDEDAERFYMVTTLELGGSHELAPRLPAHLRTALVASFVAQTGIELAAMHEASRYAHLDVRLENISFNGFGQFKLMDFNLAQELDERDETAVRSIPYGTLAAPELIAHDGDGHQAPTPMSAAVDSFCFGASAWQLLCGGAGGNPFAWIYERRRAPLGEAAWPAELEPLDVPAMRARMQAWRTFAAALRAPDGRLRLPRAADGSWPHAAGSTAYDVSALPPLGDEALKRFVYRGIRRSPALAEALLGLLDPEPTIRRALLSVVADVTPLLVQAGSPEQGELRAFWTDREASGVYHQVFRDADQFEALLAEASAT